MAGNVEETGDLSTGESMGPSLSSVQQQTPLEKLLSMSQGDGAQSYSKNSSGQKSVIEVSMPHLNAGLEQVVLPSENGGRVVVADLGCSSGPNAIHVVSQIVDTLRLRFSADTEFECYFNDLVSNDFNNLFRLLSGPEDGAHRFFAAGVPGSFFARLFPRSKVNVFHSSNSLHWVSKIPDAVLDKKSAVYNGGNVWYRHSRLAVAAAYKEQASSDLKNFLRAREAELAPGGLLFFSCLGRSSSDPNDPSDLCPCSQFASLDVNGILSDLIAEGVLTEEQRDSFNIPFYIRSIEEVNEAIEICGSSFRVLTAKMVRFHSNIRDAWQQNTYRERAIKMSRIFKAGLGGLLEAYIPQNASSVFWQRYEDLLERRLSSGQDQPLMLTICTVSLIKI